jgi:16S rRNA (uracil1498-N3)-methyltransferase
VSAPVGEEDALLRSAVALVYVADVALPEVSAEDAHHLLGVLRIGPNERIVLSDGKGSYRTARLAMPVSPDGGRSGPRARQRAVAVELADLGPLERRPPSSPPLVIGFGIPKGDRAEWTVEKLTECGVDCIIPLLTERTVVRLTPAERIRRGERYRRVAREASAQSRRVHLPQVLDPCTIPEIPEELLLGALLAEPGSGALPAGATTLLIGPEGGWSENELALGLRAVDLGPHIMRVETAAVAAGVLLGALRRGSVRVSSE